MIVGWPTPGEDAVGEFLLLTEMEAPGGQWLRSASPVVRSLLGCDFSGRPAVRALLSSAVGLRTRPTAELEVCRGLARPGQRIGATAQREGPRNLEGKHLMRTTHKGCTSHVREPVHEFFITREAA